jgi:hypothetical protein
MEHSSDATFDRYRSRIVYLISSNLFVEMGIIFLYNIKYIKNTELANIAVT